MSLTFACIARNPLRDLFCVNPKIKFAYCPKFYIKPTKTHQIPASRRHAIYNKLIAIVKIKGRFFSGFKLYAKKPNVFKRNFFTVKVIKDLFVTMSPCLINPTTSLYKASITKNIASAMKNL